MSGSLRLGFYSLQIETEPRGALLKPLTQHMAGRRDRAEQRHHVRDADEPGRRAGPPGIGSDPCPTAPEPGHHPQALPALLPCTLPGMGLGWGRVPALAVLPLLSSSTACTGGTGEASSPVSGKWEEGHVSTCSSCKGRAAVPEIRGSSLQVGHTTAMDTVRSGDQGHGNCWGGLQRHGRDWRCRSRFGKSCSSLWPLCAGKSAAPTFWGAKHLSALLTVTHTPHRSSRGGAKAPKARQRHPPSLPLRVGSRQKSVLGPMGKPMFSGRAVFWDRIRQETARRLSQSPLRAAAAVL